MSKVPFICTEEEMLNHALHVLRKCYAAKSEWCATRPQDIAARQNLNGAQLVLRKCCAAKSERCATRPQKMLRGKI
jgi:hypothetical protein